LDPIFLNTTNGASEAVTRAAGSHCTDRDPAPFLLYRQGTYEPKKSPQLNMLHE